MHPKIIALNPIPMTKAMVTRKDVAVSALLSKNIYIARLFNMK